MLELLFYSTDISLTCHFYCDVFGYEIKLPVGENEVFLFNEALPHLRIEFSPEEELFLKQLTDLSFSLTHEQHQDVLAKFELFQFKHDLIYPFDQDEIFDPDGRKIHLSSLN